MVGKRFLGIGLLLIGWLSLLPAQRALRPADETAIRAAMAAQEAAWNRGDLEAFMEGYWESDSLTFTGSRGVTYGWAATLANYQRGYPDRAAMGSLHFELLRMQQLGRGHALVIGRWTLTREADSPGGYFSLVWQKIKGRWVIIADHTS
ncbi:MAG: nuclear transport factor 2 family protein [Bacteroidetes bacterium]|nr:MAG: nuclear transport factor 2 family protein [Bacteroidota bacterium]